ncbi:hypothetical protein O6H91_20G068900 [Diphasiastrum complanatum]|uniref:Uncharacterized protein n=1 Tax=Diphasiastrum complanatum TaxID=34168 RepID=A0ACC2ARJ3_DIPCM|nr:hypothetical protein O6H91_20G068900 [Diphasiastrum complanatum]
MGSVGWIIFQMVLLALAALSCEAAPSKLEAEQGNFLSQEVHWFTQTLDHFAPQDRRQFSQRYYKFLDYFKAPDGPIFLRICGEYTCQGINNDYNAVLAKKFGAAMVCLEHRYYGESSPFAELTSENLEYLSSKQAIFDLATFRSYYQGEVNDKYNRSEFENPWFVFGISYPGALSAWFRLKFPHLTRGSVASSGVVKAVLKYTAFDEQVGESAGPDCKSALQEVSALVEKSLSTNALAVKSLFGAERLENDGDFLYFLADAAAIAFQYGNPDILCLPLVAVYLSGQDLLGAYAEYVKTYYIGIYGADVASYDQEYLKENILAGPGNADRPWWYQVCTEVAYFQVAPANNSVRSSKINTKYHLDLCANVFGNGTYPEVDETNLYYGGSKIAGSKILFMNGSQDPWRHASKQKSSPGEPAHIITCHNCGHGVDMRGCPQSPIQLEGDATKCARPDEVHKGRELMAFYINSWLYDDGQILSEF